MRLVSPGAGEISDRLTILALKILYGEAADKDVKHFKAERQTLLAQILSKTLNGSWFEPVLELAAVNASLWHAEDLLRIHRELGQTAENTDEIVTLAFRVQELNDQRAALVQRINVQAGDASGVEKI